jgi:hypothetical protein
LLGLENEKEYLERFGSFDLNNEKITILLME